MGQKHQRGAVWHTPIDGGFTAVVSEYTSPEATQPWSVWILPGATLDELLYRELAHSLSSNGFNVYITIPPGTANTKNDFDVSNPVDAAAANWQVIDHTVGNREKVILVGHSRGGAVALEMHKQQPNRVAFSVPVNTLGGFYKNGEQVSVPLARLALWIAKEGLRSNGPSMALRFLFDAFPNFATNPEGMKKQIAETLRYNPIPQAPSSEHGTIIALFGADDPFTPPEAIERLTKAYGAEAIVVNNAGHACLIRSPQVLVDVITHTAANLLGRSMGLS